MHFEDDFIQEVKNANPLFELLAEHTDMKKKGIRYKALCPLPDHNDKNTPSMTYYTENDTAYCFGCKTNLMDSIDFMTKMYGMSFVEAVISLAEKANIPLPDENSERYKEIKTMRNDMLEKSRLFWHNLMKNDKYKEAKEYLINKRGLTEELITKFKIGYCNGDFVNNDEYKKFTSRIVFPIFNHYGEICGFSGRSLPKNEGKYSKYVNSSEDKNPLFKKRELIYGLDVAKKEIRQKDYVIWVEGYMDVSLLHKYNVENVVASMGTAITEEQILLMKRFTDNIILFLDSDESGLKAMTDSLDLFDKHNMLLKIVEGEKGLDPAEMAEIKKDDFGNWLLSNAETVEQFYINKFLNEYHNKVNNAKRDLIYQLADVFPNRLDRIESEIALSTICSTFNINIKTLKESIEKFKQGGK